ncbi:MAG: ABC transporter permease [Gracilibacteraceae bacterium]|jgi:NitT/TauT family transport system permease protein|nr:ABC transporter permease [Gracilibacteraceae bacterium]
MIAPRRLQAAFLSAADRPAAKRTRFIQALRLIYQKSVVIVVLLLIWAVVPLCLKNNMFLPSLLDVLATLGQMITDGELWKHMSISLWRAGVGLGIATLIAIPTGIAVGWFPRVERYLDPLLQAMRNTSVLVILPLFILMFGVGELSKIVIIVWGCFFSQFINTIQGVKNLDPVLLLSAKSMGISTLSLFGKVVLPGSLPYIVAGFRMAASHSLLVLVASEMIGANAGLGYMIMKYQQVFMVKKMYAGILVMVILGVVVNSVVVRIEKRLTLWQERPAG